MRVLLACMLAVVASACSTDADCNLNGVCSSGVCNCVSFWGGTECDTIEFLPARSQDRAALIPMGNSSRWCAGVQYEESTSTWHLYSALMAGNCGLNSWQQNSEITHAVSKTVEGPYGDEEVIFGWFGHNPKPIIAPDGTWLIYHIGCGGSKGKLTQCTNGTTPISVDKSVSSPSTPSSSQCISSGTNILSAPGPNGPWTSQTVIDGSHPPFPASADNPTGMFFPNGSTLVMFRSWNGTGPDWTAIGLARADNWKGPYTVNPSPIFSQPEEDPFLWYQPETDSFHAIFHNMGGCTGGLGCHAFSPDGYSWTVTPNCAFTSDILFDDNTTVSMKRRERPQLVFDPVTGKPTHLISAVQPPQSKGGQNDQTYSIIVPLNVKA